uniref:Uncharacterized protein n=1 Tax=Rhipicephalus appendiculatus TaxID=34631 RepID=A0A131Z4T5_RHIAP
MAQLRRLNILVVFAIFCILSTLENAPTSVLAGRGLYPQGIENPGYISDTETGTLSGPPKPPDPSLKPKLSSGAPPDPHRHLKPTKPPANRAPVPAPRKSKHGHDGESPVAPTPAPRLSKAGMKNGRGNPPPLPKKPRHLSQSKNQLQRRGSRRRSPSRGWQRVM